MKEESKSKKELRHNTRTFLPTSLNVAMSSIGGDVKYNLKTSNISYTGFFLDFEKPGRFPFTLSSIMEVWLQLDDENTIFFNGKMTRVVFPEDELARETGPGIAIRIVQIQREDEKKLFNFIEKTKEDIKSTSNNNQLKYSA